jgi:N-acyl-D-aspartate/D-glutamate deacylase
VSGSLIRNGTVVDGTGAPAFEADVRLAAGRIREIGPRLAPGASESEIDATGCWVTPGFIDPHTHLDAQLCWDPTASPSNRHGVTSVVLGLCGFGIAPCPEGGDEYLLRSLEVVEEIPYASTRAGVPFGWSHWSEFRDHLAARPLALNAAGFVPHSALRYFVMGERARGEVATPAERDAMVAELRGALAAGAVGFATSRGPNHVDGYHEPVPSRYADEAELRALVSACRGRIWQINVETKFSHDASALSGEVARYADWSAEAGATLTWTPFHAEPGETVWRDVLAHNQELNAGEHTVAPQVTAVPITLLLRFDERSFLTAVNGWQDPLKGFFELEPAQRIARLRAGDVRAGLRAGLGTGDPKHPLTPDFELWTFSVCPTRPELSGRSLAEAAASDGVDPIDLLCDQVIADELATLLDVPVANRSREGAIRFVADEGTLLGLGDSGAHVMSVTNYRYPTFLLAELVQRRGALSVELAVNRMTEVPARLHGLAGRGVLAAGAAADVCVIDRNQLALSPVEVRHDLPGGSPRLYQTATGFRRVLVNGEVSIEDDRPTGAASGAMLRAFEASTA